MLKLNSSHHISLPHIDLSMPHLMELSPVPSDNDELVQDIMNDSVTHDNSWRLDERPDSEELTSYLDSVASDNDIEFAQE